MYVQKRWDMEYEHMLHVFKLPTLTDRRYYLDMCSYFKFMLDGQKLTFVPDSS